MDGIISCKDYAAIAKENMKKKILETGENLNLIVIQVGSHPASNAYINGKKKDCEEVGIDIEVKKFNGDVTLKQMEVFIKSEQEKYDGVIVQLPLPGHLDPEKISNMIDPSKDVDGFRRDSLFDCCTPVTGCSSVKTKSVNTDEVENMGFTVINAEKGLVYDNDTKIVYYMLNTTRGGGNARYGFGYMSPFYSKNGELCKVVEMSVVNEKLKSGYRVKGSKEGSLFDNTSIDNYLGGYGKAFNQELTSKFKDCVKKGYQYGNVSLPNYKKDSPFHIEKAHMSFTHDYDSFEELCENINKSGCKLYFNYGSNGKPTIAKFKIDLGHGKNRDELLTTLLRIYSGEYEFCGSSIQLSKKNKIILNLSMKIPKKKVELDENTVMGIDLGMAIPAACGINNNKYARLYVGSKDNFLNQRKKIREQRKRLQRNLSMTSGGHGRNKKLKPLNRLSEHEKHWVQNCNHKLSRDVVEFAKKNGAKYINMEYLKGYNTSKFILSNWSFYQVQQYIKYKAEQYGVEVRFVNPCYTSQVCSHCHKKGDRKSQSTFVCTNPECKEHGKEVNADFNASRNIAQSELFITDKKDVKIEDLIKQAKKYYNIDDSEDEEYAFD